jgi:hypothetical protein
VDLQQLAESHTKPATENMIQELTIDHKNTCAICLGDYEIEELLLVFPKCRHSFHKDCILLWLTRSGVCPVCRSDVRAQLEVGNQDSDVVRVGPVRGPEARHSPA